MTKTKHVRAIVLTVGLWLLTLVLMLVTTVALLDVLMRVYAAFWADGGFYSAATQTAIGIRQVLVLPLGIIAVIVTIGGAEYHREHFNTRQSWRTFARTLAVQGGIILLSTFI